MTATPPASRTALLCGGRSAVPRLHRTALPVTTAGSSAPAAHAAASAGLLPVATALAASTRGSGPVAGPIPAPEKLWPLPRVTVAVKLRSCVLAATVVSHG